MADNRKLMIRDHSIIYHFLDDVKDRLSELLPPEEVIEVKGEAQVLALFELKGKTPVTIAGCKVQTGKILKSLPVRIVRNGATVHQGTRHSQSQFPRLHPHFQASQKRHFGSTKRTRMWSWPRKFQLFSRRPVAITFYQST